MSLDDKAMRRRIAIVLAAVSAGCAPIPQPKAPETQPAACSCPATQPATTEWRYIQVPLYGVQNYQVVQVPIYGADIVSGSIDHIPLYGVGF